MRFRTALHRPSGTSVNTSSGRAAWAIQSPSVDLLVELSLAPARISREHTPARGRLGQLVDSGVGSGKADAPEHEQPRRLRIEELRQAHDRARLNRSADIHRLLLGDCLLQLWHGLADRDGGRAVQHHTHGALLAVNPDQDHGALEVRVVQRR